MTKSKNTMTKEEARKNAEVMMAYANGEYEIEYRFKNDNTWILNNNPSFNFDKCEYRLKKTQFRPFHTTDEAFKEAKKHCFWVYAKKNQIYDSIANMPSIGCIYLSRDEMLTFDQLFEYFVWADDKTPCGLLNE